MKSLEELQSEQATFSVGKAISDGWNLFTSHTGYYILGGIVLVIISAAVGVVPYLGSLADNLILSPCFAASAIFITWRISKRIPWTDMGDIFKGFNYGIPVFICALIEYLAYSVLTLAFFFRYLPQLKVFVDRYTDPSQLMDESVMKAAIEPFLNLETLALFIGLMIAILVLSMLWIFKYHFVVIYKMEGWPAMEMSRKIASHNLLPLLGLFFLLGLIVIVSLIPCGLGLLFSLPLSITALYSAFAQITECDKEEQVEFDFEEGRQLQ